MSDAKKASMAQVILVNYSKYYPRSMNESLTTHISIAPNHPAVIPYHIDDKILRKMNAADYCQAVRKTIHQMRKFEVGVYSAILHNKYIVMRRILDENQCIRMGIGRTTFYKKLNHAFVLFSEIMPDKVFDHLYGMAVK